MSDSKVPNVLVVDDVPVNRRLLSALIETLGWHAREASNGQECLDLCLKGEPPTLVLLDIMMPGLSGIETCLRLRQHFGRHELPIIMVTTKSEEESLGEALEAGANDYVSKPFSRAVICARMEQQWTLQKYHQELKLLQQRLKLEMVDTFALGVSHNFNNCFGGILGAAELIGRLSEGQDRIQRCVEMIRQAVISGSALTKKLSSLVRRPSESGILSGERFLRVVESVAVQTSMATEPAINVSLELPAEVPNVKVAEQQLCDLLEIVSQNAIEATAESKGAEGVLKISADVDSSRQFLMICVEDNGQGMSPAVMERLFQPFFSTKNLDRVNGVSIVGNGLSLWSAYHLLKVLGGDINIVSREGLGTKVQMLIPVDSDPANNSQESSNTSTLNSDT